MSEFKCYGISPYESNAMLSKNPHSGIYEASTARTLDLNGGNPCCHQGGVIILASLEGNGSRPSHRGTGIGVADKMFTLNTTEVHGVIYRRQKNELPKDNGASDGK